METSQKFYSTKFALKCCTRMELFTVNLYIPFERLLQKRAHTDTLKCACKHIPVCNFLSNTVKHCSTGHHSDFKRCKRLRSHRSNFLKKESDMAGSDTAVKNLQLAPAEISVLIKFLSISSKTSELFDSISSIIQTNIMPVKIRKSGSSRR